MFGSALKYTPLRTIFGNLVKNERFSFFVTSMVILRRIMVFFTGAANQRI